MSFRVGQYVTVNDGGPLWHGEIMARLPGNMFQVRVGGTSGASLLSSVVAESQLTAIGNNSNRPVVRRVLVAMLLENTELQSRPIEKRTELIRHVLETLKLIIDQQQPITGNEHRIRAIFLAPEYMFAEPTQFECRIVRKQQKEASTPHRSQQQRHINEDKKRGLVELFCALSADFRNVLIIPGTIAWRKSLRKDVSADDIRRQKYAASLREASKFYEKNAQFRDGSTAQHRMVTSRSLGSVIPQTYHEKVMAMASADYAARNTAYCFYNGNCVAKYNKIGDFHEVLDNNQLTVHIPHPLPGRFDCGGMKFGISICSDQALYTDTSLTSVQPLQMTAEPVDFHIKLSATVTPNLATANLLEHGYLLSCDSDVTACQVISLGGEQVPGKAVQITGGGEIMLYRV